MIALPDFLLAHPGLLSTRRNRYRPVRSS